METEILEKITELLNSDEYAQQDFTLKERYLAAQASADTWEAILNNTITPFDFRK